MATQRSYTAPCPGCGAPVEFRSAQSTHAVCSFCRSTIVRDGETLARVGKVAELFEDHSPLQLLARGTHQGRAFTVVGRLQYRGATGAWTEWNCLFEDGGSGWLSEDNGAYVFSFPATAQRGVPEAAGFRLGATTAISGTSWTVSSNQQVALVSAQGELPKLPPLDAPFAMVELRNPGNEVLSIDYGSTPPAISRGRPVALEELRLSGLREDSGKVVPGRQFACPNCGAPVEVKLADSKAITCRACKSLIDLTQGIGGELRHAEQDEPVEPRIPLGKVAQFKGKEWQVVGYQSRLGTEPDDPDEHFGWEEYLLYNRNQGFAFLVDSTEGWSFVRTVTGVPQLSSDLATATYLGTRYRQQDAYQAQVNFVEGEFYWPVQRGQVTFNRDYAFGSKQLAMEETAGERTWSAGGKVDSAEVEKAFGLPAAKVAPDRGDVGPTTPSGNMGCGCASIVLLVLVVLVFIAIIEALDDEERSTGAGHLSSGGGWTGRGGTHK